MQRGDWQMVFSIGVQETKIINKRFPEKINVFIM
jgi:hypothetical protein